MTPVSHPGCVQQDAAPELLEIDVIGSALPYERVEEAVGYAAASAGIDSGHVAVSFVDAERIAELNLEWRGKTRPTGGLSFPLGGKEEGGFCGRGVRGVFIFPEHTPGP